MYYVVAKYSMRWLWAWAHLVEILCDDCQTLACPFPQQYRDIFIFFFWTQACLGNLRDIFFYASHGVKGNDRNGASLLKMRTARGHDGKAEWVRCGTVLPYTNHRVALAPAAAARGERPSIVSLMRLLTETN